MSTAFLGSIKDFNDEKLEQALCAMRDVAADAPPKKLAVLTFIAKYRETPENHKAAVPQQT